MEKISPKALGNREEIQKKKVRRMGARSWKSASIRVSRRKKYTNKKAKIFQEITSKKVVKLKIKAHEGLNR